MIARYDIIQREPEWHEIKHAKIGGTKGGVKEKTLLPDIVAELTEPFVYVEDGFVNDAMMRGIMMEDEARTKLEFELFIDFKECGWLQSEENDLLGISPDGITECETIQCEIKCPSPKKHMEQVLSEDILSDYIDQLIHAFVVNPKLEKHYFCSYRPENTLKPIWYRELTRDTEIDMGLKKTIEIPQYGAKGQPIKPKTKQVPDIKTIREWVEIKREEYKLFREKVYETIESIKNQNK
jgi:hypothetical protein